MGDEEATRVCGCCQKEVAEANFALHESHCRRFLAVCPQCEENVPRSELQKHLDEQHAQVRCPKCQKKMEKRVLAEHEDEDCPARVEACTYCDLELAWSELQEHAVACGSRTELCPDCGCYVKLSEKDEHNTTCSGPDLYNEEPSPARGASGPAKTTRRKVKVLCKVCLIMFPADEIKKHEMKCTAAPKWNKEESDSDSDDEEFGGKNSLTPQFRQLFQDQTRPKQTKANHRAAWDEIPDPYEHGTCPHCQLVLPHTTLRWHERKCKLHQNLRDREAVVSSYV